MAGEQVKITTEEMKDQTTQAGTGTNVEPAQEKYVTTTADMVSEATSRASEIKLVPGWNILPPEELPRPTYWPVIMALAITLIIFGVVTTYLIIIIGLVLFVISLIGWIGDVRNEQHGQH